MLTHNTKGRFITFGLKEKNKMLKRCVVCDRPFEAYDRADNGRGARRSPKRKCNCITCSKKCSVINGRNKYKQITRMVMIAKQ